MHLPLQTQLRADPCPWGPVAGLPWLGTALVVVTVPSPTGPAAAAVRGRSSHEDVRQGQGQCQPAHFPPQQEVLQEVTGSGVGVGLQGRGTM